MHRLPCFGGLVSSPRLARDAGIYWPGRTREPDTGPYRAARRGRVLVVGDVMVDHYVTGKVSRVSDEAPVPIIQVTDERWTPGARPTSRRTSRRSAVRPCWSA